MMQKQEKEKPGMIFDMDGVLFDTERIYAEIWYALADEMEVELPKNFSRIISGTGGEDEFAILEHYYHIPDGRVLVEECSKRMLEAMKKGVPLKPGAREILVYLKEMGYHMALASGSEEETILSNLKMTGLLPYFESVVSGYRFEKGKPDPEIFLYSAKAIEKDPANCYIFEDSYNGIRAAHAAGAKAIMIPDMVEPNEEVAGLIHKVYRGLNDVLVDMKNGSFFEEK